MKPIGSDLKNNTWEGMKTTLMLAQQQMLTGKELNLGAKLQGKGFSMGSWQRKGFSQAPDEQKKHKKKDWNASAEKLEEVSGGKVEASSHEKTTLSVAEKKTATVMQKVNRQSAAAGPATMSLKDTIVWAEILGEPVSKKRRRKRMERYGDQGYAHRG